MVDNNQQNEQYLREFNASAALQAEFGTVEIYAAYRRAEVAGRIKSRSANPHTAPAIDSDPERAEFRKLWDTVLVAHQHQYDGFESAFKIWQRADNKIAAEQAFKQPPPRVSLPFRPQMYRRS